LGGSIVVAGPSSPASPAIPVAAPGLTAQAVGMLPGRVVRGLGSERQGCAAPGLRGGPGGLYPGRGVGKSSASRTPWANSPTAG